MLTEEAVEFLEINNIREYTINPDESIDVNKSVFISTKQDMFPVKFGRVTGIFNCTYSQLASLERAPRYINDDFYCQRNQLTSLHNIHKHIKEINGIFYCHDNFIKRSVLGLLLIKGIKEILLDNYEVQSILNKYLGQGRAGVIGAQQELLDAGLDEYARL